MDPADPGANASNEPQDSLGAAPHPAAQRGRFQRGLLTLAVLDGFAFVAALLDERNDIVATVGFHGAILAFLLAVYVVARAGRVRTAGLLLVSGLWLIVTLALVLFSSMHGTPGAVYMVPVMVAGAMVGPVAGLVAGAVSLVTFGAVFAADAAGWLPPSMAPATKANVYSAVAIPIAAGSVMYFVLVRDLEDLVRRATTLARERFRERERAEHRAKLFAVVGELGRFALSSRAIDEVARYAADRLEAAMPGVRVRVLLTRPRDGEVPWLLGPEGEIPIRPDVHRAIAGLEADLDGPVACPPALAEALFETSCDTSQPGFVAPIRLAAAPVGFVVGLSPAEPSSVPDPAPGAQLVADLLAAAYARAEAESRMMQAQKLEVVGRLAGGVAHDFNNLLTAMRALSDDLRLELSSRPGTGETIDLLGAAIDRASLVTGQLLAVSKRPRATGGPCDVAAAVRSIEPLLSRILPDECRLDLEVPDEPMWARVDIASLEQVLLNLVVNAFEAMPEGGQVTVRVHSDEHAVELAISDTGVGMSEAVRARLFDPFFTTKPDGTGLGMAVVRDLTRRYGAFVDVDSKEGDGTTVRIRFHRSAPREVSGPSPAATAANEVLEGRSVIVVEDNDLVRTGVVRMLESMGAKVRAFDDGSAALAAVAPEDDVDLVISDLHMPGLSGDELASRMLARLPKVRVLITSGDRAPVARDAADRHRVGFIEKPFDRVALARAIQDVFEGADDGATAPGGKRRT